MLKNIEKTHKSAFFYENIWSYQKKAVPLHSLSKRKCGILKNGAVVQLVRIHACHAWGRGFESRPHRKKKQRCFFFFLLNSPASVRTISSLFHKHNNYTKKRESSSENSFSVIQLGLEPRTPSLKGMCSTCWATESRLSFRNRLQNYCFFLIWPNILTKKC